MRRAPGLAAAQPLFSLTADHQLPGYARDLVRQRHGCELGRLALEQLDEPRGDILAAPIPYLPKDRGGAAHQYAAQGLVAGACNHAEPYLTGS